MSLLREAARKIKRVLIPQAKIRTVHKLPDCEQRLAHAKSLGFNPSVIFDGGAFTGRWAQETHHLFPSAHLVLIEPNSEVYSKIDESVREFLSQTTLIKAAVGEVQGRMNLNIWDNPRHKSKTTALAASSLLEHVQGSPTRSTPVEVKRIDDIAEETGIWPDLLKLDLQGAELPALKGAVRALESCELCIVEFGCLEAYKDRTSPAELLSFMDGHGYALYDIVDIRYRPYDNALTGGDFFFVKRDSPLKAHKDFF
jgi:FkbM family methyltransferase